MVISHWDSLKDRNRNVDQSVVTKLEVLILLIAKCSVVIKSVQSNLVCEVHLVVFEGLLFITYSLLCFS